VSVEWLAVEFVAVTQQHAEQKAQQHAEQKAQQHAEQRAPQTEYLRRSYYK